MHTWALDMIFVFKDVWRLLECVFGFGMKEIPDMSALNPKKNYIFKKFVKVLTHRETLCL